MKKLVWLTASSTVNQSLARTFENKGYLVDQFPIVETVALPLDSPPDFSVYRWIVLTSQKSVEIFSETVSTAQVTNSFIIAVGKKTAAALKQHGFAVFHSACPESQNGIIAFFNQIESVGNVLFPCGNLRLPTLEDYFTSRAIAYTSWVLYQTQLPSTLVNIKSDQNPFLGRDRYAFIIAASPSALTNLATLCQLHQVLPETITVYCIGPTTVMRARELGFRQIETAEFTMTKARQDP